MGKGLSSIDGSDLDFEIDEGCPAGAETCDAALCIARMMLERAADVVDRTVEESVSEAALSCAGKKYTPVTAAQRAEMWRQDRGGRGFE